MGWVGRAVWLRPYRLNLGVRFEVGIGRLFKHASSFRNALHEPYTCDYADHPVPRPELTSRRLKYALGLLGLGEQYET